MNRAAFLRFYTYTHKELIRALVDYTQKKYAQDELPEFQVRLELSNGHSFEGDLIKVSRDETIVGVTRNGPRAPLNVAYIPGAQVTYISILRIEKALSLFCQNPPQLLNGTEEIPTRLQLSKAIQTMEQSLKHDLQITFDVEVMWDTFPIEQEAVRYTLQQMLEALEPTLRNIGRDELGREALQAVRAFSIKHVIDSAVVILKAADGLVLEFDFSFALPEKKTFIAMLEDQLSKLI